MRTLAAWLLPRYAAGHLPRALARFVRRAVENDVELAARYEALRRAERAIAGDPPLSAAQLDTLLAGVLDDVADAAAKDESVGSSLSSSLSSSLERWGLGLVGAAACAAFVVVGTPSIESPSEPSTTGASSTSLGDLQARGAAMAAEPVGVRVRCVDDTRVSDEATAGARQRGADLECAPEGLLAFSTTNLAPEARYAFVVGVDDDGGRVWLGPFARASAAAAIPAGTVDVVLDRLAPMTALPEHLTLHVLLSDAPFSGDDVERRLAAAERAAVPLGRLDRLPVDVPVQSNLTLYRLP
jgi:hypothetical protein